MPRCYACDKNLSDAESTRKVIRTDGSIYYPDLCNECYSESDLGNVASVSERPDLVNFDTVYDEIDEVYEED